MTPMPELLEVFCDESGATGENLLNPNQKYFAYSSVAIPSAEAEELVEALVRKHHVQGGELKGQRLLRYVSGRRAVSEIVGSIGRRSQVALHDKEYALAGRMVDLTRRSSSG